MPGTGFKFEKNKTRQSKRKGTKKCSKNEELKRQRGDFETRIVWN